jgi:uncharacterized membrane protein
MAQPDTQANQEAHWRKTSNLMWIHLGIWFFFGYIVVMFVRQLFVFAKQQNKIDREFGYAEDDE